MVIRARGFFIILFMAVAAAAGEQAPDQWNLANKTKDGIIIYSRTMPGSNIREYRATIAIDTVPGYVWRAVMDKETYKHLPSYVVVDEIYRTGNDDVWYNYQVVAPPLMSRRDYTLRYRSFMDPGKKRYLLLWAAAVEYGPPPTTDIIRLTRCDGSLAVDPDDSGRKAVITYRLCLDPGGSVPAWVVNIANRSSVPGFLRAIRDRSYEYRDGK